MGTLLWGAGILVVIALAAFFYFRFRPRPIFVFETDLADCRRWLELFFRLCRHGSLVVFESSSSPKFVQFVKVVESADRAWFHCGFPDAKWSRPYFKQAREALRKSGINCVMTPTGDKTLPAFLTIDGLDLNEAYRVLQTLWRVMVPGEETRLRVTFWGRFDPREPAQHLLQASVSKITKGDS